MADYDPDSDTLSTSQGEYELEKVWEDLRFVALTKGLTIQHKGWALEEMEGPGQVAPDPMRFDGQAYTPATKTEAKELLLHEQKRGHTGGTNLFYLAPIEDVDVAGEEGNEPTGSGVNRTSPSASADSLTKVFRRIGRRSPVGGAG